jgi:hypothetical protein
MYRVNVALLPGFDLNNEDKVAAANALALKYGKRPAPELRALGEHWLVS